MPHAPDVLPRQLQWEHVRTLEPLWLNLGGRHHCHPHPQYRGYVSVDVLPCDGWHVLHDLTKPLPLPDNSVDRLHSEDAFHYLTRDDLIALLHECYRVLKPGGRLRFSVPDYDNPKDRQYRDAGSDPRHPRHLILTTKPVVEDILRESPFSQVEILQHWQRDAFVGESIDESLGTIQRTPQRDPRNREAKGRWKLWNFLFRLRHGFHVPPEKEPFLRGTPLHVTSLVVDCVK